MSLLQTLFGGMALVLLLHWLLARMGIANYWRGVIAGALPTLGYLAYSGGSWPGLDTVAIHVTLFLATATVATLLAGVQRKSGSRLHWAPKAIALFFVALFVVNAAFVSIASKGLPPQIASMLLPRAQQPVYTGFSGVTEHNTQAARAVSQQLKQLSQLKELGWHIEVEGLNGLAAGRTLSNAVTVRLRDRRAEPMMNAIVTLDFFRPGGTQALLQTRLQPGAAGEYRGAVSFPDPGIWVMKLAIGAEGKHIEAERDVTVLASK